jgi:hypothetical protein
MGADMNTVRKSWDVSTTGRLPGELPENDPERWRNLLLWVDQWEEILSFLRNTAREEMRRCYTDESESTSEHDSKGPV